MNISLNTEPNHSVNRVCVHHECQIRIKMHQSSNCTSLQHPNRFKHIRHQQAVDNKSRCVFAFDSHFAHVLSPHTHGFVCVLRSFWDPHHLQGLKKLKSRYLKFQQTISNSGNHKYLQLALYIKEEMFSGKPTYMVFYVYRS